jgi:CheY-like chemotaxis protein
MTEVFLRAREVADANHQLRAENADRLQFPLPRILILDLKMPRMSGMDVLRWLKSNPVLECLPKVILSSSANRMDVERGYRLGANAFLIKPSTVEERSELIRIINQFWIHLNQPPLILTDGPEAVRAYLSAPESAAPFL